MRRHMQTWFILVMFLSVAGACTHASRDQRVGEAAPPATTVVGTAMPISEHPPITTTGVVAGFDRESGLLVFQDGRMVKLTEQSKVSKAAESAALRPGDRVVVRDALPVGVQSVTAVKESKGVVKGLKSMLTGKRQRMATVASVDSQNRVITLTDGSAVSLSPSTKIRMGTEGQTVVLADLRPGDELVIVVSEGGAAATGSGAGSAPSALPRGVASPPAARTPMDADEVMIFRDGQAP